MCQHYQAYMKRRKKKVKAGAEMVSIKDVAKQAGVAISTVSKVLNGYPGVSEMTKKKVEAAHRAARSNKVQK